MNLVISFPTLKFAQSIYLLDDDVMKSAEKDLFGSAIVWLECYGNRSLYEKNGAKNSNDFLSETNNLVPMVM